MSHENGYRNIKKALGHGFSVIVLYVHQDISSAWKLTQDRELVKKRAIERNGFIKTCQSITISLRRIFDSFRDNPLFAFWVVKKNDAPGMENSDMFLYDIKNSNDEDRDAVEQILNESYNIDAIKGI